MAEDSGAFKTNLRIRAGFRYNIMIPALVAGMPHRSKSIGVGRWDRLFLTIAPEPLQVFSNQPDSQHFGGPRRRTALSSPRSLMARGPSQILRAKAEYQFMLPGFRFLFAAIVLSMSMLIFGLGAAALLRAAHEEFASIPSRRAPETMFAQRGDTRPTLALVRIEPSAADQKAAMATASDSVPDQPAIVSTPPEPEEPANEPDKIATLTDAAMPARDSLSSDSSKPEASTSEISVQPETPAQADAPSPAAATKLAAIAEVTPIAPDQATVTAPDQAAVPVENSTRIAETKIATLGGPPVTIGTNTPSKVAPAAVKKFTQARRIVKRRRIAQRVRVTPPAPRQPANPFGTPFGS
jgi:hypothetical protein